MVTIDGKDYDDVNDYIADSIMSLNQGLINIYRTNSSSIEEE
tara:strand:- start:403 stop:528 length:126 start_codon:yes stop_codon:yes gene_type:complete